MIPLRRVLARVANAGLVAFGLASVVVLGTGGTRLDLGVVSIGLREIAAPATFLCAFAALRLLAGTRHSGLEARVLTFLARQGLPPRDAPATPWTATRAGSLLGMGFGLTVAAADMVRLLVATPPPSPTPADVLAVASVTLLLGLVAGLVVGSVLGLLVLGIARATGAAIGRYDAGRYVVAVLLVLAPGAIWLAPPASPEEHTPAVLLSVAGSIVPVLACVFLVFPAAVARARRGRWGLAATCGAVLGIALAAGAIAALGPTGLYAPARDASYPNVLLVSISGLRLDATGFRRGAGPATPVLERLAGRGALFADAISPSTDVAAAAASSLTGLYPATHGLRGPGTRLRPGIEGLPIVLAGHGFRTAAFVSSRRLGGRETGLAEMFERYDDPTSLLDWLGRTSLGRPLLAPSSASPHATRSAEETVGAFRDWVSNLPRGPWFAWVQLADLLRPAPERAPTREPLGEARLADVTAPLPNPPSWADPIQRLRPLRDWLWGYSRAVHAQDSQVEVLQQIVNLRRGELHRTLVIVVSESGDPLGEGGVWFDRPAGLDVGVLHVPWVVAGPGVWAGTVVGGPCSLVDVTPTALGLIGVESGNGTEGEDLSRYLVAGNAAARDPQRSGPVFAEKAGTDDEDAPGPERSVQLGRWRLLREPTGAETLFVSEDGVDHEVAAPRGREERQREILSDELTRRQAAEQGGSFR